MSHIVCDDPNCFNHDEGVMKFCGDCLEQIAGKMSNEDLYEIYLDCEIKLKKLVSESNMEETPEKIVEARTCSTKLFDTINELMMLKKE